MKVKLWWFYRYLGMFKRRESAREVPTYLARVVLGLFDRRRYWVGRHSAWWCRWSERYVGGGDYGADIRYDKTLTHICLIWYISMIVGHVMRTVMWITKNVDKNICSTWYLSMVMATVIRTVVERKIWEETKNIGRRTRYPGNSTWIFFGSFKPDLHKTRQDVWVWLTFILIKCGSPQGRQETRACCWQWRGYWRCTRSRGASGRGTPSTWVLIQMIMLVRICPASDQSPAWSFLQSKSFQQWGWYLVFNLCTICYSNISWIDHFNIKVRRMIERCFVMKTECSYKREPHIRQYLDNFLLENFSLSSLRNS